MWDNPVPATFLEQVVPLLVVLFVIVTMAEMFRSAGGE